MHSEVNGTAQGFTLEPVLVNILFNELSTHGGAYGSLLQMRQLRSLPMWKRISVSHRKLGATWGAVTEAV